MVQSNHASLESGITFGSDGIEPASLIVLRVKNQYQLTKALTDIEGKGIDCVTFDEPSWDYGFTAFATEPVTEEQKSLFKRYQLWR